MTAAVEEQFSKLMSAVSNEMPWYELLITERFAAIL